MNNNYNLFSQPWEYSISRNVTLWHNSLTLMGSLAHYGAYRLPNLHHVRVHRGFHADFYMLGTGEGGRQNFVIALRENFCKPEYLSFLQSIYKKNGEALLALARETKADHQSMQTFFDFYAECICLLDITAQASKVITDHVVSLFKDNPNSVEIIAAYSAPKMLAPVQEMERTLDDAIVNNRREVSDAVALQARFGWIPANFVGEPWDTDYFIERIKHHVPVKREAPILPYGELTDEQRYYCDVLGEIAVLNEYRKAIFSQVNLIIRPLFDTIGHKMGLSGWKDVGLCLHQEILDFLQTEVKPNPVVLSERQKICLLHSNEAGEVDVLYGSEAQQFEETFALDCSEQHEVRGMIANKGKVRGRAKIVLSPADFSTFYDGDILIAKMTSVDFIPIMKKAGAFVTDEGGLASHAAIIAREYNKPCIIGTKIATKIFKNGDIIEVDAEIGLVKKK